MSYSSTLTLRILKKRYLARVQCDSLSPEAKHYMKQVIGEELVKSSRMQVSKFFLYSLCMFAWVFWIFVEGCHLQVFFVCFLFLCCCCFCLYPARTVTKVEVRWRPRSPKTKGREKRTMTRWQVGKKMNPQLRNHVVSQAPHQVGQNFSVFTMIKNTENPHIF